MPIYEYEHLEAPCALSHRFEVVQPMAEKPLTRCPECGGKVRRIISAVNISTPKTNSELRDLGFTKLVRRDDGVYENVTARGGKKEMVLRDTPGSRKA